MPQMGEGEWRLGTNPQNVLSLVTLFSEYTRALTLENFCKA